MVIDSSALLAILGDEPERRAFIEALEDDETRILSAVTWVETSLVISARHGDDGLRDLDLFVAKAAIEIIPVDLEQASAARRAFLRFGKGRHPAALNFGDCFTYALAEATREAVLFKGDDFSRTDLDAAVR